MNSNILFKISISTFIAISLAIVGLANSNYAKIGVLMIYAIFAFILFVIVINKPKIKFNAYVILCLILSAYLLITPSSIESISQNTYLVSLLFFSILINATSPRYVFFPIRSGMIVAIIIAALFLIDRSTLGNPNYIAVLFFLLGMPGVILLSPRYRLPLLACSIGCLIIFGARSVLLGATLSAFVTYYTFYLGSKGAKFVSKIMVIIFVTIVGMLFIQYLEDRTFLDNYLLNHTGKRLDSGRIEIWLYLLNFRTYKEFLIGTGEIVHFVSENGAILSAHSGFVFAFVKFGLIGTIFIIMILYLGMKNLIVKNYIVSYYFATAIIFREIFETTLFSNHFPLAFIFWGFLMTGAIDRLKLKKSKAI